jgi:hypothetical protein
VLVRISVISGLAICVKLKASVDRLAEELIRR